MKSALQMESPAAKKDGFNFIKVEDFDFIKNILASIMYSKAKKILMHQNEDFLFITSSLFLKIKIFR